MGIWSAYTQMCGAISNKLGTCHNLVTDTLGVRGGSGRG